MNLNFNGVVLYWRVERLDCGEGGNRDKLNEDSPMVQEFN